jgi:AcrR family transcriptional regulator
MAAADRTHADGRATRDEVIQAAIRAFAERGYRSASMNAIAAEVGITRQGLLYHFPSKDDLLLAVIAQRDEEEGAELPQQIERHESLSDIIQAALQRHAAEGETVARLFTVLAAESIDPQHPAHDYFVDRYRRGRELVTELIASEQAQGRITSAMPPEQLAIALLALMDGLQLQAQLEPEPLDIDRVARNLMAVLSPSS